MRLTDQDLDWENVVEAYIVTAEGDLWRHDGMRSDDDVTWYVNEEGKHRFKYDPKFEKHADDFAELFCIALKFKSAYQNMWKYHNTDPVFHKAFTDLIAVVDKLDKVK